jgi:hypothetical protein
MHESIGLRNPTVGHVPGHPVAIIPISFEYHSVSIGYDYDE